MPSRFRPGPAARLALIYLVFSTAWILLSDHVVATLTDDEATLEKLQSMKGLIFVSLSGLILYFSSLRFYAALQNSLRKKEELLGKMVALNHATGEGIVDYDFQTDSASVNNEMRKYFGSKDTIINDFRRRQVERIHPSDLKRVTDAFAEFLKTNGQTWQAEYRFKNTKGEYRDILSRGYVIRQNHKPAHLILALQDVTELRDANSKYYEQQMNFRQSITRSIIEAQERERNRWAEELHDDVGQTLTVAKLFMEQLLVDLPQNPYVSKSKLMVQTALDDIRQLSAQLKPPEFAQTTLLQAVNDLVTNIKRIRNMDFHIFFNGSPETALSEEQKLMIYRVVQEQLNNILKYAEAKRVTINLDIVQDKVTVKISDDGKGFDPDKINAGIGLKNIRSRLQVFSGNLIINSTPGKGCELKAAFGLS